MTSVSLTPTGIFIKATITLKRYIDNGEADTLSLFVTNLPQVVVPPLGNEGDFVAGYPILLEVGELAEEHDEWMPRQTTSSITISNAKDSLGFQRRFSDLLEYYSIAEQDVTIEFLLTLGALTTPDSLASSDVISTWKLKASSVTVDLERETVTIDLKNSSLTDKVITKQITASEFPNAPTSSIGKYLPVAIGAQVPVVATRISDTEHALTTTIGTTYPILQVTQYYAKQGDTFYGVIGAVNTSTNIIDSSALATDEYERVINNGYAFPIYSNSNYLIDRMEVQLTGMGYDQNEFDFNDAYFTASPTQWEEYKGATYTITSNELRFTTAAQTNSGIEIKTNLKTGLQYTFELTIRRVSGTAQTIKVLDGNDTELWSGTPTTSNVTHATVTGELESSTIRIVQPTSQAGNVIAVDNLYLAPNPQGQIELEIVKLNRFDGSNYAIVDNENDWVSLGKATIAKEDYAADIQGSSDFYVNFNFPSPVLISDDGFNPNSPKTQIYGVIRDVDQNRKVRIKSYTETNLGYSFYNRRGKWKSETTRTTTRHKAKGITLNLTDGSTADSNGLGYSKITVGSGSSSCDLTKLQLAATVDGLESGGFAHGYVYQILPFFFSSDEFDTTDVFGTFTQTLIASTYGRTVSGSTNGRVTRLQLARELLRNSGARLISLASSGSTKVGLYYWGGEVSRSGVIDDRFCKTVKYGIASRSTVINNITASYARDVIFTTPQDLIEQGASSGYSAVIENERLAGSNSITLYGSNDLANATFPYIRDSDSMDSIANFYLRTFEHPYKFVEFYIPYAEGFGFPDAEELPTNVLCSEVIELVTAQMPAFYGTSARPINPVSEDNEDVVETSGFDFIRAKRYRLQVESKRLRFIDGIPVVYFTCKILDNENDPT